jgi:hypothetical protein
MNIFLQVPTKEEKWQRNFKKTMIQVIVIMVSKLESTEKKNPLFWTLQ